MRNDESAMNVDEICNVVSILTKDENIPEANSNEDNEMPKFTVLDENEEMMKGRQKEELNSLKDDSCEKDWRWVDRERDGRVKSRKVLKDYNRCQGRVFTNTVTLSLKTMLAASSHDRNNDPESNHFHSFD